MMMRLKPMAAVALIAAPLKTTTGQIAPVVQHHSRC